jgi:FAD dependent oxidoreductase TIGR03364
MQRRADVAVVGGGILGLAHTWAAARRGRRVLLFERGPRAQGASVRNFGMIWPIGQPAGRLHATALRSRQLWLEAGAHAGIWVNPCGSLHLAHAADEWAVLAEFAAQASALGYSCELLTPDRACERSPAIRRDGLRGALWSTAELCVDPRQAVARLPAWLQETFGVELHYGTTVCAAEPGRVRTTAGHTWDVGRTIVCGGVDFQTLFPEVFAAAGLRRCKLQMMRTALQPGGWRVGPHLAGGLTLCHYAAFQVCPTLPALRHRLSTELPDYVRHGIHVMVSQNHLGEVVIGDSHEYDDAIEPFDKSEIDRLILDYLRRLAVLPDERIAARWHGEYAKHSSLPWFVAEPLPGVALMAALGGAGMTLAFGVAEEWWNDAGRN